MEQAVAQRSSARVTREFPFLGIGSNGTAILSVRGGIPADDALDAAHLIMIYARELSEEVARAADEGDPITAGSRAVSYLVEIGKALIEAIVEGPKAQVAGGGE
jgi:hypothetical protein